MLGPAPERRADRGRLGMAGGEERGKGTGDAGGRAPLAQAIMEGRLEEACRLLDAGADPGAGALADGTTALHAAAFLGDAGLLARLLALGADPAARDGEGATALHVACGRGSAEACALLLAAGADPSAADGRGRGPIFQAAGRSARLVRLLVQAGAGVDCADRDGFTPLHEASLCLQAGAVQALLDAGADPNAEAGDGSRPIDLCYGAARALLARAGAFPGKARFALIPDWGA